MKPALLVLVAACGAAAFPVRMTEDWPKAIGDYEAVTKAWTRQAALRGQYQEVLDLSATFKSPDWRAAHAEREAGIRRLTGDARAQVLTQARADMAGPYEVELMLSTWDRRENDLDRGKRSMWRVVLVDDKGQEVEPLEIIRDHRSASTVRDEFPAFGDFATPYIARFPRTTPLLGPDVRTVRLRMTSERGGVELDWAR